MSFRKARIQAGLRAQEVAKELGVSRTMVYLWETGQNLPKSSRLTEIAALYGVTVDELIKPESKEEGGKNHCTKL